MSEPTTPEVAKLSPLALLRVAAKHWRFFRRVRVLRRKEVATVIGLATLTVMAEASGMAMLLPILSFVEQGRDVGKFAASGRMAGFVVDAYQGIGIPVSLLSLSLVALVFVLLRQGINYLNNVESERIKWTIGRRLSVRFFRSLLGSTAGNIRNYRPGQFTATSDYECQAAASIPRIYAGIWMQLITFAAYLGVMFFTAPGASLMAIGVIAIAMACLGFLIRATRQVGSAGVDIRKNQVNFLNERFRAWKLIKLSDTLALESLKADDVADQLVRNRIQLAQISGRLMLYFTPVMSFFLLGTLYMFVEVLAVSIAAIMLFILILLRMIPVSAALQKQIHLLALFDPSLDLIDRTLRDCEADAERLDVGRTITRLNDEIRFEDVVFAYPDREHAALSGVTAKIPARKMTAVIGPSGAGKSTLVDLIPRIIEPTSGRVLVDGVDAKEASLRSLRQLIAYVPQAPFLFAADVMENIRYLHPDASDEEVTEAARLANADDFIRALPQGYRTDLGEAGDKLSGGQKQRIVLARAFLARRPVLILDEPTSALDHDSDVAIQHSIENLVARREVTVIIIAHRLSTVRNADHAIHLMDGKTLRSGPAAEVLRQAGDIDAVLDDELRQTVEAS